MPPGGIYRAGQAIVPGWRGYRKKGRRQKKKKKREKKKEKKEKKGKLKEGNHWACANTGPDHATVTTVRLHYSDCGALESTLQ